MMTPEEQVETLIESCYEYESPIDKEWRLNIAYEEFMEQELSEIPWRIIK